MNKGLAKIIVSVAAFLASIYYVLRLRTEKYQMRLHYTKNMIKKNTICLVKGHKWYDPGDVFPNNNIVICSTCFHHMNKNHYRSIEREKKINKLLN